MTTLIQRHGKGMIHQRRGIRPTGKSTYRTFASIATKKKITRPGCKIPDLAQGTALIRRR